ncbi:hypothetical protein RIF23_02025 [Lipingzhangella sp. LS1_29]|uniref:DUF397 domain-containing protein n=1 Tax=Lipingzhangella rawalii TaxID=2055835 RepID=A0ABU2H188_9ACTN|nr:hypothetical protein [Lipingzhangella rawalii]MDS1269068.1 hypothetical protein [Lipingzhangella rawalii]
MRLTRIAGGCGDDMTCPTISVTDRSTVIVQGYELSPAVLPPSSLPEGESAVEIPMSVLQEAVHALGT